MGVGRCENEVYRSIEKGEGGGERERERERGLCVIRLCLSCPTIQICTGHV